MLPVSFYFFVETWDAFWSRIGVHCSSVMWLILAEEQLYKMQLKLVVLSLPLSNVLCKIICAVKKNFVWATFVSDLGGYCPWYIQIRFDNFTHTNPFILAWWELVLEACKQIPFTEAHKLSKKMQSRPCGSLGFCQWWFALNSVVFLPTVPSVHIQGVWNNNSRTGGRWISMRRGEFHHLAPWSIGPQV